MQGLRRQDRRVLKGHLLQCQGLDSGNLLRQAKTAQLEASLLIQQYAGWLEITVHLQCGSRKPHAPSEHSYSKAGCPSSNPAGATPDHGAGMYNPDAVGSQHHRVGLLCLMRADESHQAIGVHMLKCKR